MASTKVCFQHSRYVTRVTTNRAVSQEPSIPASCACERVLPRHELLRANYQRIYFWEIPTSDQTDDRTRRPSGIEALVVDMKKFSFFLSPCLSLFLSEKSSGRCSEVLVSSGCVVGTAALDALCPFHVHLCI